MLRQIRSDKSKEKICLVSVSRLTHVPVFT